MMPFDRDIGLDELLDASLRGKLGSLLSRSFADAWQLADADGTCLLGASTLSAEHRLEVPLRLDFETAGRLIVCGAAQEDVERCAAWLELALAGSLRYRMAADLHTEAMQADYEALRREHAALQASEAGLRELSSQLERRVAEQVETISLAQRQLYQAEKMASVGSLAAGMAHEINNPIGFIRSNAATSLDYVSKLRTALRAYREQSREAGNDAWNSADVDFILEDFPVLLAESISGADRVARIVGNLKRYANIDYAVSAEIDLNESVQTVADIVGDQLPQGIALTLDLRPLPRIHGDQGRLNQMLLSIMQNAVQAISGSGEITVSTCATGDEVHVAISDTGIGMPASVLGRIFDPFFTTRDVGQGVGLGLTVSRDIASAHGGCIDVRSEHGKGSTFSIRLPFARKAAEGSGAAS